MADKEKIKVLVVDDEEIIRDFLSRFLSLNGVEVKAVEDGFRAVETVKEEEFDLFFIDARMPMMDGLETFIKLKNIKPNLKCVMMTGYVVDDLLQQAKKEGAILSIRKPFDISEIEAIVETEKARKAKGL